MLRHNNSQNRQKYKNGVGEAGYACCEIKDNVYEDSPDGLFATSADWTVIGATNGKCCSGYTQYASDFHGVDYILSFSIRQNGGVYYCASELTSETDKDYYESDSKFCHDTYMDQELLYKDCFCSDSGDPRNGTTCVS